MYLRVIVHFFFLVQSTIVAIEVPSTYHAYMPCIYATNCCARIHTHMDLHVIFFSLQDTIVAIEGQPVAGLSANDVRIHINIFF